MRTPGNLSCSYQCEDERNLDLSTPKSNTIHASDKIHTDIDLARCLKTSNVVELDLVLKNIREYRLNEIYQDISIIFKYNVLFCDAYNTMAVNTFFAILDKLLEMEKSIMNPNHFKTIEYKQLFKEKIKGIDISTSRSAILSKVPVHNMLKKHVDIKKNIKGFTSKLFVSIFFALEYIESVIFGLPERINCIIMCLPDLKSDNINFNIHMNLNLMLYTGLAYIVQTNLKKILRYYFHFSEARGNRFIYGRYIFENKDTLYLLDAMFYFDDSDISDIYAFFESLEGKCIYELNLNKETEPIIENLSNKLIYKIIGYFSK
ncbi:hypothetical protein CWI38_0263p0010 [Hamiltosporidium tvaerminnensis]|uniref:Uncharacterized protein n=1 Tax=Hamiltosporidium tvaerminnensis TaxID=1176355 RepID=A0A4V2JY31_9MICR|nr:hypothetical protein CWI38_0263p0010 [Hamiltosporidium tvaerminnensis]